MDLPQVQMIRLQPPQALVEHLHRQRRIAPMRTNLRHQEDLVATPLKPFAQPVLRLPPVVLPAVVEKRDAPVHSAMDNLDRRLFILRGTQMMPA
jgi:hypothetical protein